MNEAVTHPRKPVYDGQKTADFRDDEPCTRAGEWLRKALRKFFTGSA
jgi:hypothetical protein